VGGEIVLLLPRLGEIGQDAVTLDGVAHRALHQPRVRVALHEVVLSAEAQRLEGQDLVVEGRHRDDGHRRRRHLGPRQGVEAFALF